ncbi:DNA transposase THAP9 [Huso huso]|uniref:DNA transposase THAP9 n=1 Tax=Huso huso TaxID=61971 RepID=A0ABR0ZUK0_HUSHU
MPATCVAINCSEERSKDTAKRGITFHSFPKDPLRRKLWRAAVRRRTPDKKLWEPGKNSFLCSRHFKPETFDRTGQTVRLRDHAVPTEFNFTVKREKNEPHRKKKRPLDDWQQESQDHDYSLPSVEILAQKHRAAEQAVGEKEWQIKNMKEVEKGLKLCCVNAIDTLLEKKLISIHLREKLLSYGDIPLHLFEKPVKEFSLNQKSFVTTLLLYNPNAYEFLQKKMKLPLPDPEIIRTWLKSSDDSPGFNSCVINALAHNKKEKPDEYTHACLIIDTMAIQQHISYNSCKKTMTGFVDLGNGSELQGEPANQVLVLMLVGIKGQWKAPIAYFFANQLTTEVKKALVWHALEELVQLGFEVVAITMDSHPTNVGMCKLLGCKFTVNQQLKTYFKLPDSDHKCYVIFDVSRELKLKRSDLEAYGTIKSQEGYVNWDYIKNLHNLQGNADLHTENTQSQEHIRASAEKIKVSLVAQPFSSSVAELLNMLHGLHVPQFEDCLATVSFIEVCDFI